MPRTHTHPDGAWRGAGMLLRGSLHLLRSGGAGMLGIILGTQLVVLLLVFPVLRWLFRQALRSTGMTALDLGTLRLTGGFPLTVGLILLLVLLAFILLAVQYTLLMVVLSRVADGAPHTVREISAEVGRVAHKLLRPSSLPLIGYLFIVLPLTGFGFTSAFIQRIEIPEFISGELAKSTPGVLGLLVLLLLLMVLCIRFALILPLFALSAATGGRAARLSWRLTRGRRGFSLIIAVSTVTLAAGVLTLGILLLALTPVALSDWLFPAASPVLAALSLGLAQTAALVLTGMVTAAIAGILLCAVDRSRAELPERIILRPIAGLDEPRAPRERSRRPAALVAVALLVVAGVLGVGGIDTMQRLSDQPETLILAHRGFTEGGVENTLGGLEAAAAAGADLVEMDVMQTRDGEFVVMHDVTLSRLAGQDLAVRDLTLAELEAITVHDGLGHSDTIPSLETYVTRAAELGMPLLIEIKFSGAEGPDHVERLVDKLEELGALENNIYHSLDAASVTRLKTLRPDLTVGYIMPVAGGGVPQTRADFIVVEQWTATTAMREAAERAGLGFMVWTVNDPAAQRTYLREGVSGIITDRPDTALDARSEMGSESGMLERLADALQRVFVF